MTTADTMLFLGLLALAYWLEEPRLQAMAGVSGMAAGLSAAALAPSPWVGLAVLGMGIYLLARAVQSLRTARRDRKERQ